MATTFPTDVVLELQMVMFEAFQQAHRAMVLKKPNYSIQKPPSSNMPTADGHIDTESDQVLINGRKAYVVNYYRTTCRITVNGLRTATFLRDDIQCVLEMLSGLSSAQIATLTRCAHEAIQAAKSSLSQDSNPPLSSTSSTINHTVQSTKTPDSTEASPLSILGASNSGGPVSQAATVAPVGPRGLVADDQDTPIQSGALVRPTFTPAGSTRTRTAI